MATKYWTGQATAVAQVDTVTAGGTITTETFTISVGGVAIASFTASSSTANQVRDALVTAWNASTHPYANRVTAAAGAGTGELTLTADNPGEPFVITLNTPGGSATFTRAATTASAGPHDWSTDANWSDGSAPVNSDVVVFGVSGVSVFWGLGQSAVTLAELRILQGYTGYIGLDPTVLTISADGGTTNSSYAEYRDTYLRIGATAFSCGQPGGNTNETGSGRIKVNFGSVQTGALVINSAASSADAGWEAVRLLGTHASNTLTVSGGIVGTATENASEVSTWATINVGPDTGKTATVNLGAGCTLTTINVGGGTVTNRGSNATTVNLNGGTYYVLGSATVTTLNVRAGATCNDLSDGTVTTLNTSGTWSTRGDARSKTVTNCSLYKGGSILADSGNTGSVTFTNGIDLIQCGLEDVTLRLGKHYTLTQS